MKDYALEESRLGVVTVHRADCPQVRMLAAIGEPVATLYRCAKPMPPEYPRHECLEGKE